MSPRSRQQRAPKAVPSRSGSCDSWITSADAQASVRSTGPQPSERGGHPSPQGTTVAQIDEQSATRKLRAEHPRQETNGEEANGQNHEKGQRIDLPDEAEP